MIIEQSPKKIEMLLIDGDPNGLRYVDIGNKTIRSLVAPRTSFKQLLARNEMNRTGIYILYGASLSSDLPMIYIGQTEILGQRLADHNRKKDFWTDVITFTSKDDMLDGASVGYIESVLIKRVVQDKLVDIETGQIPSIKNLSEANKAVVDEFIEDIMFLLHVMGYKIARSTYQQELTDTPDLFIYSGNDIVASGRDTDSGFIVYKQSKTRKSFTASTPESVQRLQRTLIGKNVLREISDTQLEFTKDHPFDSPSMASSIILGRSSNGRTEWKTEDGRTLKQLQEE